MSIATSVSEKESNLIGVEKVEVDIIEKPVDLYKVEYGA